jgi:hypothetical protein
MNASKRCVETVEKIVDEGLLYAARVCWCAGKIGLFCVTDLGKRCNKKEAKFEETNFVKQVVKIVRWSLADLQDRRKKGIRRP